MSRLPAPPLLVITDRRQAVRPLVELAERAFAAGCRWLSVREKDLPEAEQAALARRLAGRAASWGATVTLHGSAALAAAAGLAGVHLPAGADAGAARRRLGPGALIGQSVHDRNQAETAAASGVDYAVLGPVFATASKPGYGPALEESGLARIIQGLNVPVLALGGITPGRVAACRLAGAAGVAVMGAAMTDADGAVVTALVAAVR